MSSIDYLKFLLKKTDEEREQDINDEEKLLIQQGKIPRPKAVDVKTYLKHPDFFAHEGNFTPVEIEQISNMPKDRYHEDEEDDKKKAINKLKALLAKEGETNSGEKSHIEDKERQEKETKTPENLLTWSRLKREFDDETHEDPY